MARAKHRPAREKKRILALARKFNRAFQHEDMLKMHRDFKKKNTSAVLVEETISE